MGNNQDINEQIDHYLRGEMNPSQKAKFEAQLSSDQELKREYDLKREIVVAIRKKKYREILVAKEIEIRSRKRKFTVIISSFSAMAAAACFLGVFLHISSMNNCKELSDKYFQPYPNIYEMPSRGDNLKISYSDSLFYKATLQISTGDIKEAITILEKIDNKNIENDLTIVDIDAIKWYKAIAYLKDGKKRKAKPILKELADDSNCRYYIEATEILKKL